MKPNKILYILSTNYAGSHFLTLQLASHSKCISVGELHRLDPIKTKNKQSCHICKTDNECPVFKGLHGLPLNQLHNNLLNNIESSFPGVDTLIDNSKKTVWANKLQDLPGISSKYVHIIRDPRALVRRWMMNYDTTREKNKVRRLTSRRIWPHFWDILTNSEANVYAWKWAHQNKLISDFLSKNRLDHQIYTYDELVFEPDRVLSEIMLFLGHDYEPAQKEYWNFTHHGSQKPQYMKPPKDGDRTFDIRWKEYLSQETQLEIFNHPAINEYLDSMGIHMGENGLLWRETTK
jgi:hypothetical protein